MRSLHAAIGLFTVVPVPSFDVDRRAAARAMAAFPWLGVLLGAAAGAVLWGGALLGAAPLGVALALALLAAATGALHLDGLADTADGLGSRAPAERALEIMRRSDIGPMGVVTLVFVLGIDAAALLSIDEPLHAALALVAAVAVSRLTVTFATVSRSSARAHGFGALFVGVTRGWVAGVNALLVGAALVGMGWWAGGPVRAAVFAGAGAVSVLVGAAWGRHLRRRLGGWTGDTFGSLIEVTQAALLVALALSARL